MNDLRLLLQVDPHKKIISLEFKYAFDNNKANSKFITDDAIASKILNIIMSIIAWQ